MMMLNPIDYLKTGYSINNDDIYYNNQIIYSKMGSYYYGTLGCKPSKVSTSSAFSCQSTDFTSTGLKNEITRNAIEEVVWNLGESSYYPIEAYSGERSNNVYENNQVSWIGKVGLMYSSDYGYATSGGDTKSREACLESSMGSWDNSEYSDCLNNNYLRKSSVNGRWRWMLSPDADDSYGAFFTFNTGEVSNLYAFYAVDIYPTVYLKNSLSIVSGKGTADSPYQLTFNN